MINDAIQFRSRTAPARLALRVLPVAAAVGLLFWGAVTAHDFWVQPAKFLWRTGETVPINLFVGDHFQGESFGRYRSLIERFIVAGPEGAIDTFGREGSEPAGLARLERPGLYVIGYRSKRSFTGLDGPGFQAYLAEQGLDAIQRERESRGESNLPVREAFSRCAKALIQVGDGGGMDEFPTLGFTLELTVGQNPYRLAAGDSLPVRLAFQGQPLPGALVTAVNQRNVAGKQSLRTDENGQAAFKIDLPGLWMIRTVHLIPPAEGVDADYESLWASLTFELPDPPPAGSAGR